MDGTRLEAHDAREEVRWRAQVLKRTSHICAAKAKELERMAGEEVGPSAYDAEALSAVLKRIDNVMEWRFVDALGEVVLDADILADSIDCDTLRAIHRCVEDQLRQIKANGRKAGHRV